MGREVQPTIFFEHDQNDVETSKTDTRVPRRSDGHPVGIPFQVCHPKIRSFAIFYWDVDDGDNQVMVSF